MLPQFTLPGNFAAIRDKVAVSGWAQGPWTEGMLDVKGFYIGSATRDASLAVFENMFKATAQSQTLAIQWAHTEFARTKARVEVAAFELMVKRLVLGNRIGELLLASNGVQPNRVESFEKDIVGGLHHAALDGAHCRAGTMGWQV